MRADSIRRLDEITFSEANFPEPALFLQRLPTTQGRDVTIWQPIGCFTPMETREKMSRVYRFDQL